MKTYLGANTKPTAWAAVAVATAAVMTVTAVPAWATTNYNYQVLVNFGGTSTTGTNPNGDLAMDSSGNLYGTTNTGGSAGSGTVFRYNPGSDAYATLANFTASSPNPGVNPEAGVTLDGQGNLYGTASGGGPYPFYFGTVFKVDNIAASGTHNLTVLAAFGGNGPAADNASAPRGNLLYDGGHLYGTTPDNLFNGTGAGHVFDYDLSAFTKTYLHSEINGTTALNSYSGGVIKGADGNFYGTASSGGPGNLGGIFKISDLGNATPTFTEFASFSSSDGYAPVGGLITDANGNFYGTARAGGANGDGTIFKVDASGTVTALASFDSATTGTNPTDDLVMDSEGNLYGMAGANGTNGGTIFKYNAATGDLITLFTFTKDSNGDFVDGSTPQYAGLLLDNVTGNLYGLASAGGTNNDGVLFELSPAPEPTTAALVLLGLAGLAGFTRRQSKVEPSRS